MKYIRSMAIAFSIATAVGCASTKNVPITQEHSSSITNKTITSSSREMPDFSAMTAGKAMFGVFGAAAMISEGNDIIQSNNVEDPSIYISQTLAERLSEKHASSVKPNNGSKIKSKKGPDISKAYPDVDYVLDIETLGWGFSYFPTSWGSYRVIYTANLRLIDTDSKQVISQSYCSRIPESDEGAPTHDELLADNAAVLKKELLIAAEHCISEFSTNALKL